MYNKTMEIALEQKLSARKNEYFSDDMNINSSDITKERINNFNKMRKNKINNQLFNKGKNISPKDNKITAESNAEREFNIVNLNIDPELKNETYINAIINEDNLEQIIGFITNMNLNIDYIKYGLYLLNEKMNLGLIKDINELNKYNFKEIFFSVLNYSKNESTKLNFDSIILELIYDLIINYINICKNLDISFLCNEQFFELHLYFLDYISDISVTKNILKFIGLIGVNNNDNKMIYKLFEYNDKLFFNKLIEILNNNQLNHEICEIILQLYIKYINLFNDFKKIKSHKSIEIEMKDDICNYDHQIIETIYNTALILIFNKHFDSSLYLISNIIKILYKSKNFDVLENLMTNKNSILMMNFLLEKDYSDCTGNLVYMSQIMKYIIKFGCEKNNVKELIDEVDNNLNENKNILSIFIDLLVNNKFKIKEKICLSLIDIINIIIKKELYINAISESEKYNIYKIIIEYLKSSNYKIRKRTMEILEKIIVSKKDYIQADYLIKNKILYFIKQAIDPSVTYCYDEKLILMALNVIDNLLSLGDMMKNLNGVNTVLIELENIGGKEMLDNLLSDKSELVFSYASHLLDKYFI